MPKAVPIEIFMIGKTQVDRDEVKRWLDFLGATEFEIPAEENVSNPALLIALAGKRCYKSFEVGLNPNISRIRKDYDEYFENILASGHGSVLEHSVYNLAIENVSRVFTGEMNRHRAGWAISEGSMRFIRYSECIPYWVPDSIKGPDVLDGQTCTVLTNEAAIPNLREGNIVLDTLEKKQHATRAIFHSAFLDVEKYYRTMEFIWKDELAPTSKFKGKKEITSMMRRIVGMGVATGGVWSGNIRGLRHVITMRASAAAEEEMLHVFSRVAKMIRDTEPHLFGDFVQTPEGFWVPKYLKV